MSRPHRTEAVAPRPAAHDAAPGVRYGLGPVTHRLAPVPRSGAGGAWLGACSAAVVVLALIIFIAQNTADARISFLGLRGTLPLAAALFAAALAGAAVTLALGAMRIARTRRRAGRRQT
jgi:uncharacterized integral membrane protein